VNARDFLVLTDAALLRQCELDTFRSSGPGGQKRNKTSSGVRLRHQPTGVVATAVEDRSQHVNKARAIRRLRLAIALNIRGEIPADYQPSELLQSCLNGQAHVVVGLRDERYPVVVAELLDVLVASEVKLREAATRVGIPTSHLVRFFDQEPKVWQTVNELRTAAGHKPLR
jgi:hypothetical protein